MKHFILVICSFSSLFTQKSNIDQILISTKINGVSVKLGLDNPLDSEFVTAWFDSKTNWYYITAYQATGDKRVLEPAKIIETIETRIIPNLNIPEKVFLSILEISQRAPYKIRNTTRLKIIRFINELST